MKFLVQREQFISVHTFNSWTYSREDTLEYLNFEKPGRSLGIEVPWNKANKITLPNRTFRNKNRKRKNSISFETL